MKYTIREMMKELTGLTDLQWGGYAFYHEPLERKFTPEQKENNNQYLFFIIFSNFSYSSCLTWSTYKHHKNPIF